MKPGTILGHYRVAERLGRGGMGEVYRAEDLRLGRNVAIKLLPAELRQDPERLARLATEARLLASLNHPHIATLHGLEEAPDGMRFLVMELVEGGTLADRLQQGALPLPQVYALGVQMAAALAAAHEQGIVHRDLKPGNVMLVREGVKLIDFGLARAERRTSTGTDSLVETRTLLTPPAEGTQEGMLVGTLPYMSPEQLEGREADARSDLWALGAVLYEMATGRPPFVGDSSMAIMAAILERDPLPLSAGPRPMPPALDHLVAGCLTKDRDLRRRSAADLALDLRWLGTAASDAPAPERTGGAGSGGSRARRAWMAAVIVLAAAVSWLALIALQRDGHDGAETSARFDLAVPDLDWSADETGLALSPAGDILAYTRRLGGRGGVWLRRLDEVEARRLPGTEGAVNLFWSPDGGRLGYVQDDMIQVVDLTGGPTRTVARGATFGSPTWGASDIVYAASATEGPSVLFRVAAKGGQPEQLTRVDPDGDLLGHAFPIFLPDGSRLLYLELPRSAERLPALLLGSLDGGEPRRIDGVHSRAEVAGGFLFYCEKGVLLARPFDVESAEFRGEARIVARLPNGNVARTGHAMFSVTSSGVLAYATAKVSVEPIWFDREGRRLGALVEPGPYSNLRISPTGDRVAASRRDPAVGGGDLWIVDVARSVQKRVSTGWPTDSHPVWSPDGRRLAYASDVSGAPRVFLRDADGGGEPVPVGPANGRASYPSDWSPDGTRIAAWVWEGDADTWMISLGDMETSKPYLTGPGDQIQARFSPDGRWVAFASSELGSMEVFIAPANDGDVRYRVSASGGTNPAWSPDGRDVFYTKGGALHAASFAPETATIGIARELFSLDANLEILGLDLAGDGRFLAGIFDPERESFRITVTLGWKDLMDR